LAFRRVGIIDPIKLVKDGTDAVRYLKGEGVYADRHSYPPPSLILLDLKMPQTSGFEVLRWVREQPSLDHVAVVVMTGSQNSEDVQRAYQLGADSYLVKPATFSDLVKITKELKGYCALERTGAGRGFGRPDVVLGSGRGNAPERVPKLCADTAELSSGSRAA
jgi:CheY-like chemotaxis protein